MRIAVYKYMSKIKLFFEQMYANSEKTLLPPHYFDEVKTSFKIRIVTLSKLNLGRIDLNWEWFWLILTSKSKYYCGLLMIKVA